MLVTGDTIKEGLVYLGEVDSDLKRVIDKQGVPPLWLREAGFSTLVHIILEQQVSLASAQATYDKLVDLVPQLNPESVLLLSDEQLRAIGFSRQKTRYVKDLAERVNSKALDLDAFDDMSDQAVRYRLMKVKGIGLWTADVYLLMALSRPDIWPIGDLALVKSLMDVKGLDSRPEKDEIEALIRPWSPWKSVAARVLWSHYLNGMK